GDRLVTLADLEDTTVAGRQPPGGESVLVRGHAAGVFFEAEFFTSDAAATPFASVSLTIYPDRFLPTVRGVRFFQTADALPGDDGAVTLVLVVRAVQRRHRRRRGREPRVQRRELRSPPLPPHSARRRLSEGDGGLGHEREVPARTPLAHRPHPRAVVPGRAVD